MIGVDDFGYEWVVVARGLREPKAQCIRDVLRSLGILSRRSNDYSKTISIEVARRDFKDALKVFERFKDIRNNDSLWFHEEDKED